MIQRINGAMQFYDHHPKKMLPGKKKKEEQPEKTFAEVMAERRKQRKG